MNVLSIPHTHVVDFIDEKRARYRARAENIKYLLIITFSVMVLMGVLTHLTVMRYGQDAIISLIILFLCLSSTIIFGYISQIYTIGTNPRFFNDIERRYPYYIAHTTRMLVIPVVIHMGAFAFVLWMTMYHYSLWWLVLLIILTMTIFEVSIKSEIIDELVKQ